MRGSDTGSGTWERWRGWGILAAGLLALTPLCACTSYMVVRQPAGLAPEIRARIAVSERYAAWSGKVGSSEVQCIGMPGPPPERPTIGPDEAANAARAEARRMEESQARDAALWSQLRRAFPQKTDREILAYVDLVAHGEIIDLRRHGDGVTFDYRFPVGGPCCTVTEVKGEAIAREDGTVLVSEHPKKNPDAFDCPQ